MSEDVKLKKLLDYVSRSEDHYYDIADKCLKGKNYFANAINSAQATVFQRVRYYIEDLLQEEENEN